MRSGIKKYINKWEKKGYPNGIPDEVPARLAELNKAPSYKQIALAILKNDVSLKSLGMTPKKSIYYSILKRIELQQRGKYDKL